MNSTDGWNATSALSFLNAKFLQFTEEIEAPVLLIHGEKAHSRYFSETAFGDLRGENKELLIIPGAFHTDLYDQTDIIPFGKINEFFTQSFSR
ncbi:MAG TPA: alpha/beta hydrolase [Candidatus Corynebacterium gallistercoris]|uniref:Alpha/beta hydrolase n=1 Tax=Candidatus Corynebacterium gallistercoris TaxID=2838530 RepID=A0A9D1RVK1_9CORY|nr:alpha/beta hydrolase [Candidatus Corynebacterium gallistercoris]